MTRAANPHGTSKEYSVQAKQCMNAIRGRKRMLTSGLPNAVLCFIFWVLSAFETDPVIVVRWMGAAIINIVIACAFYVVSDKS